MHEWVKKKIEVCYWSLLGFVTNKFGVGVGVGGGFIKRDKTRSNDALFLTEMKLNQVRPIFLSTAMSSSCRAGSAPSNYFFFFFLTRKLNNHKIK